MAIEHSALRIPVRTALMICMALSVSACSATSGSTRLDQTGDDIASAAVREPETSAYYIQALNGGLVARMNGVKLSGADRARALEAEYKVLEASPSGQAVLWQGSGGMKGEVVAAVPYQVGSQNCRQYTHTLTVQSAAAPLVARGAACRNANGSWTPL